MDNKHYVSVVDAAKENLETGKQKIQETIRKQWIKQLTKWMNGRYIKYAKRQRAISKFQVLRTTWTRNS